MKIHAKSLVRVMRSHGLNLGKEFQGVEVGTWRGQLALDLLKTFSGLYLHLVDNYQIENIEKGGLNTDDVDEAQASVQKVVGEYPERCFWLNASSRCAADAFEDSSLDFVFLDASHDYESVLADIKYWEKKVRLTGFIAGHDYGGTWKGVKRAVDEVFGDKVVSLPGRVWYVSL